MTRAALFAGSLVAAVVLLLQASSCGTPCGPTNCAGCCSAKNECVLAPSAVSCGASGAQCVACSPGQTCLSGLCTLVSASGGGAGGTGGGASGGGSGGGGVGPQPGCTLDNCHAMINACRVELIGGAAVSCSYYAPPPPGWDYATGCVTACNELGLGEVTACLAGKADVCLAARDAGTFPDAELNSCFDGGLMRDAGCEQNCDVAQRACNDVCYPRSCDACYRAGGTSCPTCPDAGFVSCMECSQACGRQYARCLNGC